MPNYYVNDTAQPNGDHEVHEEDCYWLSRAILTTHLGWFMNCVGAVAAAKQRYSRANGCAHCSPACHTS